MAKAQLSLETFDTFCESIERRGAVLEKDIQNALLLAVEYWHGHNKNPKYITRLYRAVKANRGTSAGRFEKYVAYHVPVVLATVKGELKIANDDDAWEAFSDTRLTGMFKENWADWKDPTKTDEEFDVEKWMDSVVNKGRKNDITLEKATALLAARWALKEAKMAKAAAQ